VSFRADEEAVVNLRPERAVQLSERAQRMPASPIRKLAPLYEQAKARGVHVYPLNIGQPDIVTPEEMRRAYQTWDQQVLAYGHSAGLAEYRAGLARYYARFDIRVAPEEILVTTGGSEAILFALMAVCEAGDNVLVPEPFYTNYAGFAVMAGQTWARVVGIILAVLSAFANFTFIPYYPFWAIMIIAVDVFVIWALAVHGRDLKA